MIPFRLSPLGISINERIPLTFIAEQANSTVKLTATGSPTVSGLHYRRGKSGLWLPYTIGDTITLANVGDSVQFWNRTDAINTSGSDYVQFVMTGLIASKGNIQSLLNFSSAVPRSGFTNLFAGCSSLTSPPELPALSLNTNCYNNTFYGCSSLLIAPKLPARDISNASGVYYGMFFGCSSLTSPPELPATRLGTYCYYGMFRDCVSLTAMPSLITSAPPAYGYTGMFRGCTSLTAATLPFGIAGNDNSCNTMFYGCSSLARIETSFNSWTSNLSNWVYGVAAEGTFIKPAALPEEYGVNRIPSGWTVVNK